MDSEVNGHSESEFYHQKKEAFDQTRWCFVLKDCILVSCLIFPIEKRNFRKKMNTSYLQA